MTARPEQDLPDPGSVSTTALPADPRSAGLARAFIGRVLVAAGRERWCDGATLLVSELVTNALLHAHTPVEVTARLLTDRLRIEVRDFSAVLPAARSYDEQSTTGRGLELIASVADSHGVQSLGGDGKVVWCTIGDPDPGAGAAIGDLLAEWDDDLDVGRPAAEPLPDAGAVAVVLRDLPATLWQVACEHHAALLRELALFRASHGDPAGADLALADDARSVLDAALDEALDVAVRGEPARGGEGVPGRASLAVDHTGELPAGPPSMDLRLRLSPTQTAAFAALQDALDEGEQLAAADRLLIGRVLPEIVAVRDWACEQVIAQLAGGLPAAWPGGVDDQRRTDVSGVEAGWDRTAVSTADVGLIAVDEGNRILAVSPPLLATLGFASAADLVGRRVVAIIPARYRDAHVAGFTRHLRTGEVRVLGLDLRLPVRRADGGEVECQVRIDVARTPAGRVLYLARITPVRPAA